MRQRCGNEVESDEGFVEIRIETLGGARLITTGPRNHVSGCSGPIDLIEEGGECRAEAGGVVAGYG